MSSVWDILESGCRQGLLFVPLAVGVHVSFRFARYPDLTPDGSMVLGSALTARLLLEGYSGVVALVAGALLGGALGMVTAYLSEFVGLDRILAGLASTLFAYSLTLRALGRGNVFIPRETGTIFTLLRSDLVILAGTAALLIFTIWGLFRTNYGLRLRAIGENEALVSLLTSGVRFRIVGGLFVANSCAALSGGLIAEHQKFSDVGQGAGSLFIGLACILIGGAMPALGKVASGLLASSAGAIVYATVIAVALRGGLRPGDLKAVTALLVVGTVALLARFQRESERERLFQ